MIAAAAQAAVEVCHEEPQKQSRVRELARLVRSEIDLPTGDSPIIPMILGEAQRALDSAAALREEGLLVVAVRPPTVPRGSSRLRITLSCDHTDTEVRTLIAALKHVTSKNQK
jgi:7-keto-8-aminopelargonate synthetase-like enzyme